MTLESSSWRSLREVVDQVVAEAASAKLSPSAAESRATRQAGNDHDEFRGALRLTEMASMLSAKTVVINGTTCTGRA